MRRQSWAAGSCEDAAVEQCCGGTASPVHIDLFYQLKTRALDASIRDEDCPPGARQLSGSRRGALQRPAAATPLAAATTNAALTSLPKSLSRQAALCVLTHVYCPQGQPLVRGRQRQLQLRRAVTADTAIAAPTSRGLLRCRQQQGRRRTRLELPKSRITNALHFQSGIVQRSSPLVREILREEAQTCGLKAAAVKRSSWDHRIFAGDPIRSPPAPCPHRHLPTCHLLQRR